VRIPLPIILLAAAVPLAAGVSYWLQQGPSASRPTASLSTAPPPPAPASGVAVQTVVPSAPQAMVEAPAAAKPGDPSPSFDIVRVSPGGALVIAGRAAPRAEVTVLDGDDELGKVMADGNGDWVLLAEKELPSGERSLTLRAQLPGRNPVTSEQPLVLVLPKRTAPTTELARPLPATQGSGSSLAQGQQPPAAGDASGATIIVQPGHSLWRIARERYGSGPRYETIYDANRDRIRNPDLIYPGQSFTLPK
jgi:nucleoid-associated protein YgaU